MKLIAHRGNLYGANPARENTPKYIEEAIKSGFDVEIDIRAQRRVADFAVATAQAKKSEIESIMADSSWKYRYILGHDQGETEVPYEWLLQHADKLWVHCKDLASLRALYGSPLNYFWHQEDDFTLTSQNIIWTYPMKSVTDKSVIVCFTEEEARNYVYDYPLFGVCCNWVGKLK
tara:strand:- start:49 stop:573 length:525 start_codon:yes stop_codon:yes gene_type:complete